MQNQQLFNLVGLAYALAVMLLVTILLRRGKMNMNSVLVISLVTTLLGFLIFAPLIPLQMQALLLDQTMKGAMPVQLMVAIIIGLILSSLLIGRVFCGYSCPIGSVQELMYRVPGRKLLLKNAHFVLACHIVATALFFTLGLVLGLSLLGVIGVSAFFNLEITTVTFYVFLSLVVIGVFIYRPFCRLICPFGLFSALLASKSMFRVRRESGCINCGRCDRSCPTGEAVPQAHGGDCFLCLRCVENCPNGTISYNKRKGEP